MIEIDNLGIFIPIEREKEYAITDKDVRYELLRTVLAISPQNRRMFYALVRKKFPNGVMHCAINGPLGQRGKFIVHWIFENISLINYKFICQPFFNKLNVFLGSTHESAFSLHIFYY